MMERFSTPRLGFPRGTDPLSTISLAEAHLLHADGRISPLPRIVPLWGYTYEDSVAAAIPPGAALYLTKRDAEMARDHKARKHNGPAKARNEGPLFGVAPADTFRTR